jgi:hypothetical protein
MTLACGRGELELVRAAVDAALAVDPFALDVDALHELTIALQREVARLTIAADAVAASWDDRVVWAGDGSRSAGHRLGREVRCSVATAKGTLRRSHRLAAMPLVRDAVLAGRLSLDHVELLGSVNIPERRALFERDIEVLIEECASLLYVDAVKVVARWRDLADDQLGRARKVPVGLRLSETFEGAFVIDGVLDPIGGSIVAAELRALADELRRADEAAGVSRTPAERRAAALVEMATRSRASGGAGTAKPLFIAVVGDVSMRRLCELTTGTVVREADLVPYVDSALLETVLFDDDGTIVSVSRQRSFTGALRRAIMARDRRCRHESGCDVPAAECDVDHIVPYAEGGMTSQDNGRCLCTPHNRKSSMRDHASPRPARDIGPADRLRALMRWRLLADSEDDPPDSRPECEWRVLRFAA